MSFQTGREASEARERALALADALVACQPAREQCSTLCHPKEPCSITADGRCAARAPMSPTPSSAAQQVPEAARPGDVGARPPLVAPAATFPAAPPLMADTEALARDAARYRWLRGGRARTTGQPKSGRIEIMQWQDRYEATVLRGEKLDTVVDAAIEAAR